MGKKRRGFAAMDPDAQRKIAAAGGRAAHAAGAAHEFNAGEAQKAGRRGGKKVARDKAHMAEIGRRGGKARAAKAKKRKAAKHGS